jgi:CO/xanthine dehydrogenase Mo-binding subunit
VNEIVPTHTIGDYVPLVDGPEKVSGRAKYTADLITPDMLGLRFNDLPVTPDRVFAAIEKQARGRKSNGGGA